MRPAARGGTRGQSSGKLSGFDRSSRRADRSADRWADRSLFVPGRACYAEDMRVLPWLVVSLGLALSLDGPAGAACSSTTCTDLAAIDNMRAVVSAAC